MNDKPIAELFVKLKEWSSGLRLLSKMTKSAKHEEMVFKFEDELLSIKLGGGEVCFDAQGQWEGEVKFTTIRELCDL